MKKSIFSLGKTLNKKEQKLINGGIGDCDLPENGPPHLCPGGTVVINPITCLYWCQY